MAHKTLIFKVAKPVMFLIILLMAWPILAGLLLLACGRYKRNVIVASVRRVVTWLGFRTPYLTLAIRCGKNRPHK